MSDYQNRFNTDYVPGAERGTPEVKKRTAYPEDGIAGDELRDIIERNRWRVTDVAKWLGVKSGTVAQWIYQDKKTRVTPAMVTEWEADPAKQIVPPEELNAFIESIPRPFRGAYCL